MDLCSECSTKGKSLNLQTQNILYTSYCEGENFEKPDLIIGFNLGIIAYDSWEDTILKVLQLKCPLIFTAFSERDAKDDQGVMERKFKANAKIVKNPFASLRPKRSITGDKVFYENQFLMIFSDVDNSVEKQEDKFEESNSQNLKKINNEEQKSKYDTEKFSEN